MQIGFIGLGKMGEGMTGRLLSDGHEVFVFDLNQQAVEKVKMKGGHPCLSAEDMANKLGTPRIVWIMVPAGHPTDDVIDALLSSLSENDIIIDGGNSYYKDSLSRAEKCKKKNIHFVDVGTSGGIWGPKIGYCLMAGADEKIFNHLTPIFKSLSPENGFLHTGKPGSGHYVKMIHNGIEYGLLQAYGEGFALLEKSDFNLDLKAIAGLWNNGSVVRSWLLELAEDALSEDPKLAAYSGIIEDSGEGRWTVLDALEKNIPAPVITLSMLARFESRIKDAFSAKFIAVLRNKFGGHKVEK